MWLLVGLGNPGTKYEQTRHNLGYMALDELDKDGRWKSERKSLVQKTTVGGHTIVLAKPLTYMNLSGDAVQALLHWYKIPPERLIVFVDDINLDCGRIRIRGKGSHGGQNGLRSIIAHIGSEFIRVRIGAGKAPAHWDLSSWVLSKITPDDAVDINSALNKISELTQTILDQGLNKAMEKFNGA
ncbi:MAG: aminoacyl-tRNA hydrolase [Fibrobacter sp.]|nr:aminoacyl-tRNA hydrolase [Fibrobacter sp.]